MKLAVVGASPFSYVIRQYLENVKGIQTSVIGKTPKGQLKFFFWANDDTEKEIIRSGLSLAKIAYEEMPFRSAILYNGTLVEELTPEIEDAFFKKTNTEIQFVGSNVSNFFVSTPEDPSEWIIGETDTIRKTEAGWSVNLLGLDIDVEMLAATIPLPILGRIMGVTVKAARMFIYREQDNPPFDPQVNYQVVWDVDNDGVYRWVKHSGMWNKEEFSFKQIEGRRGYPQIRYPRREKEFAGAKLYGPFAEWNPKAGLASVLTRLKEEY